jgi:diguanylate cyclase (GGDEF)-like protein/PAS domain S-box-containing protein
VGEVAGSRAREPLVAIAFLGMLLALLLVGVRVPDLVEPGMPPALLRVAAAVAGTASCAVLAVQTRRAHGRLRLSWALLATTIAFWTLTMVAALSGWDDVLVWGVLRGATFVISTAGLLLTPGVWRPVRQWGFILLDGWLVGGSVLIIGWVALEHTGSFLAPTTHPALCWIGADLLMASVISGLAMRTDRGDWLRTSLLVLASLLAVTGDTTWALTGKPHFPTVQWIIMVTALAITPTGGGFHRQWSAEPLNTDPPLSQPLAKLSAPGLLRWSQVAVVPGLVAAMCAPPTRVVPLVGTSVVLAMAVELALVGRHNSELWTAMHTQAGRLDRLISDSRDAIIQLDTDGVVEFANSAVIDVLGRTPRALLGRGLQPLIHPDDLPAIRQDMNCLGTDRTSVRVTARIRRADGGWRSVEATVSRRSGDCAGLTVLARDVSEQVELAAELHRLATTDTLTGLINRHGFLASVDERLASGDAAVLFVDLDGFKAVNDVLGHAAGDRLLQETAGSLRAELGPEDIAARLGGDEFAVLAASPDRAEAGALAARIADRLRRLPSDAAQRTSASVGVAIGHGGSAEDLLGDADLAMYEAKARGGGRRSVFHPEMRRYVTERARLRAALDQACHGDDLRLHLQPIVSLDHGTWRGFEALIRWQDGPHLRQPEDFLPLAEETGLIVPLGEWVLRAALTWLAGWPDTTAGVSVNIASRQVADPGFGELVASTLRGTRIEPHRLTLEITEQTAIEDIQRAGAALQPLRALGVHVSLDDFGTGFSSLGYLAQLPVDELKIDRRFVAGLGQRAEDDTLVRTVLSLATDLGLRTVAEGVETSTQVDRLISRGCPLGQGYFFRAPAPADRLGTLAPSRYLDGSSSTQCANPDCKGRISPFFARSVWR